MTEELDSEIKEVIKKLSQQSDPSELVQDEKLKETAGDSETDSTHQATNPYVDTPTHSSESLTRPSHLALPNQQSEYSVLRPLTSPALEGQCLGNKPFLSPNGTCLSTSAPDRAFRNSWNSASSWTAQTQFL